MKLHHSTGKPDWHEKDPSSYNSSQKLAAATNGIVSPANIITIIGFGLVMYGLIQIARDQYWTGLILLTVGRLLDIVDGVVAEATKTKSPLGELLDASLDKISTIVTILVLLLTNIAPWWVMLILLIPQVAIAVFTLIQRRRNIKLHPSRFGKLSMVFAWMGIVGLLAVKAIGDAPVLEFLTLDVIGISCLLGLYTLWRYITGRD